jgi:hypothetical protein
MEDVINTTSVQNESNGMQKILSFLFLSTQQLCLDLLRLSLRQWWGRGAKINCIIVLEVTTKN